MRRKGHSNHPVVHGGLQGVQNPLTLYAVFYFGVCAYACFYGSSSVLWLKGQVLELDSLDSNPDFATH